MFIKFISLLQYINMLCLYVETYKMKLKISIHGKIYNTTTTTTQFYAQNFSLEKITQAEIEFWGNGGSKSAVAKQ